VLAGTPTGEPSEVLEPCDGKLSCTVLRGEGDRKVSDLPGPPYFHCFAESRRLYESILIQLKNYVRQNKYVVTTHAAEEIDEDDLSIFDIERVILNGEIIERQKDEERSEWKYLVRGHSIYEHQVIVVVKLGPNDKMIIITVFKDE